MAQKWFPPIFLKWATASIYEVPFSIVLNGEIKGHFSSSNDLRQDYPLSPLLFTVVMDSSCLIEREISLHNYCPISNGDRILSYLLFVDDLFVTGIAKVNTIKSSAWALSQ